MKKKDPSKNQAKLTQGLLRRINEKTEYETTSQAKNFRIRELIIPDSLDNLYKQGMPHLLKKALEG